MPDPTPALRPSWPAIIATLIGIVSLYANNPSPLAPALAVLTIAACLTRLRLPKFPLFPWLARAALFTPVIALSGLKYRPGTAWLLDPQYINLFGLLCASELIVQCLIRRSSSPPNGEVLLLSTLIMMSASATFDRHYIPYLAPAYAMFVILSFRSFRPHTQAPSRSLALRSTAILLALTAGLAIAESLRIYGQNVTIHPFARILKPYNSTTIGLSPSPRLSPSANMQPSPQRVLRIDGSSAPGHLRAWAFDTYTSGRWTPDAEERQFEPFTPPPSPANITPTRQLHFTRLIDNFNVVCLPLNTAAITPAPHSSTEWESHPGRTIRSSLPDNSACTYDISLPLTETHQGPLCLPLNAKERARFLAVPEEIDPRVRALAKQIATSPDPQKRVAAIASYLQSNHTYSLTVEPTDDDPVSDFLLNKRSAHCQFFASAAVILLRCADVPARFVTGYYAHESAGPRVTIVRQRDAHAWTECWIDGLGWITLDATPATGRPDLAFPPAGSWQKFTEWFRDTFESLKRWFTSLSWRHILAAIIAIILLDALIRLFRLLLSRRRSRPRIPQYSWPDPELALIAARFERLLKNLLSPCPPTQTWQEHLSTPTDLNTDHLAKFLADYNALRFGHTTKTSLATLRDDLAHLESHPRQSPPAFDNGESDEPYCTAELTKTRSREDRREEETE